MEVLIVLLVALWLLLLLTLAVWLGVGWLIANFPRLAHPANKVQAPLDKGFVIEDDYPNTPQRKAPRW